RSRARGGGKKEARSRREGRRGGAGARRSRRAQGARDLGTRPRRSPGRPAGADRSAAKPIPILVERGLGTSAPCYCHLMYTTLLALHSWIRWIALIAVVGTTLAAIRDKVAGPNSLADR